MLESLGFPDGSATGTRSSLVELNPEFNANSRNLREEVEEMIYCFKAVFTIYYGKDMLSQLASEV